MVKKIVLLLCCICSSQITAAEQKQQLTIEFLTNGFDDSRQALLDFMVADHLALSFQPKHQRQLVHWYPQLPKTTVIVKEKETAVKGKEKRILLRSQSVDFRPTTPFSDMSKQDKKAS